MRIHAYRVTTTSLPVPIVPIHLMVLSALGWLSAAALGTLGSRLALGWLSAPISWDSLDTQKGQKACCLCFHDCSRHFCEARTDLLPPTAKMIFVSAAAVIFLVTKFKEIDWAKTCVVLPDDEEDHERYFLSDQPHSKDEPTPQMVRSVRFMVVMVSFVPAKKNVAIVSLAAI